VQVGLRAFLTSALEKGGAGGSVVVKHYAASRKVEDSTPDEVDECSSISLILPAALGPGVNSASNRNEHQKQKNNVSGE
jgi:hypothetical protein